MIVKVVGVALLSTVCVLICSGFDSKISIPVTISSCLIITAFVFESSKDIIIYLEQICTQRGYNEYFSVIAKGIGIVFLCSVGIDICDDCGQRRLGRCVEFAGKVELLITALPLIKKLIELSESILIG